MAQRYRKPARLAALAGAAVLVTTVALSQVGGENRALLDLASDIDRHMAIERIEARVERQDDVPVDLADYSRRYSQIGPNGEQNETDLLFGVYESGGINAGTATWAETYAPPSIDDGGCAVIELSYSVRRDRILSIQCNGEA